MSSAAPNETAVDVIASDTPEYYAYCVLNFMIESHLGAAGSPERLSEGTGLSYDQLNLAVTYLENYAGVNVVRGAPHYWGIAGPGPNFGDFMLLPRGLMEYDSLKRKFEISNISVRSEKMVDIDISPNGTNLLDVFISHSSEDSKVAEMLISLILASMTIPPNRIRCTSVPGYKLEPGVNVLDSIRKEISDTRVFIALLTPTSIKSEFVLFELGARWSTGKPLLPLLSRGLRARDLPEIPKHLNAMDGHIAQDIDDYIRSIAKIIGANMNTPSVYKTQLDTFIDISNSMRTPG